MLMSSLCDYKDVQILVQETIKILGRGGDQAARQPGDMDKKVAFKNNNLVRKAKLDKAGFQNDMGYGNFKDLPE